MNLNAPIRLILSLLKHNKPAGGGVVSICIFIEQICPFPEYSSICSDKGWEWCLDQGDWKSGTFTDTYINKIKNPLCKKGSGPVIRGGCWSLDADRCRSSNRGVYAPSDSNNYPGFRIVFSHD